MKQITIIGGGLAGLTLGILLRRKEVPVTVYEAGSYPRHRVCGEFISGAGQHVLAELGLSVATRTATDAAFFVRGRESGVRPLPRAATCVSRHVLDAEMASRFQACGGVLRSSSRRELAAAGPGTVIAAGRRLPERGAESSWFGLKVHAREARLCADLEMHAVPQGYVGLCRLPGDEVNVCGLFQRRPRAAEGLSDWRELLRGAPGSALRRTLDVATFDESSFCSVAGLSLDARPPRAGECRIGDALTMIPPVTGNGMSMAFESARLASGPVAAFAAGDISWDEATAQVASACSRTFDVRLRWARWLHRLMFQDFARSTLAGLVVNSSLIWRLFFAKTR